MANQKRACLVYVAATRPGVEAMKQELESAGYDVCAVEAVLDEATKAQAGEAGLPYALEECIRSSDLCVFLLPEEASHDGALGGGAGLAGQLGKRLICIVAGDRENYPEEFDDAADSMLRQGSDRLDDALNGNDAWERPDRSPVADRPIKHVRCQ